MVALLRSENRYIVDVRCKKCGERFILKGRMKKGKMETGFKRCLCDNEEDFDVQVEKLP